MRHKVLTISAICLIVMIGIVVYLPIYERNKEISDLKQKANYLIQKVEAYKLKHHKLTQYENDMNLSLPDDYPISYAITKDSLVYVVGFEIAPFESMVYHSDSKTWTPQQ